VPLPLRIKAGQAPATTPVRRHNPVGRLRSRTGDAIRLPAGGPNGLPLQDVPTLGRGPLLAVDGGSDVTIEVEEAVGIYGSSQWAERGV